MVFQTFSWSINISVLDISPKAPLKMISNLRKLTLQWETMMALEIRNGKNYSTYNKKEICTEARNMAPSLWVVENRITEVRKKDLCYLPRFSICYPRDLRPIY